MKATCAKNAASIFASGELGFAIAVASTVASDSRTQAKTAIQIAALSGKWRKIAPWVTPMRSAMACAVIASGPRSRASYQDRSDDLALPFIAVQTLAGCRLECGWSIHSGRVLELLLVSAYYRIQAVPVWQALKSQGGRDREVSRLF
jgi:hypothetical protein